MFKLLSTVSQGIQDITIEATQASVGAVKTTRSLCGTTADILQNNLDVAQIESKHDKELAVIEAEFKFEQRKAELLAKLQPSAS